MLKHQYFKDLDAGSFALLTEEPEARRAVVFVHGFGGKPCGTWSQMPEYIAKDDGWKQTDAYFIGYNSTRDAVMLSATYLTSFIQAICPVPPMKLFRVDDRKSDKKWLVRSEPPHYDSIDLVGHSLGGVVLRAAILKILKNGLTASGSDDTSKLDPGSALACNAKMRLFAPAQGGARIAGLIGLAARAPVLRDIVDLFRGRSPSFQELSPEQQLLSVLRDNTNYYADRYPELTALRASIAWAHHDDIVTAISYRHDAEITVRDTNHKTICKPWDKFPAPFYFLNAGTLTTDEGAI
jgi:hypothetical protein